MLLTIENSARTLWRKVLVGLLLGLVGGLASNVRADEIHRSTEAMSTKYGAKIKRWSTMSGFAFQDVAIAELVQSGAITANQARLVRNDMLLVHHLAILRASVEAFGYEQGPALQERFARQASPFAGRSLADWNRVNRIYEQLLATALGMEQANQTMTDPAEILRGEAQLQHLGAGISLRDPQTTRDIKKFGIGGVLAREVRKSLGIPRSVRPAATAQDLLKSAGILQEYGGDTINRGHWGALSDFVNGAITKDEFIQRLGGIQNSSGGSNGSGSNSNPDENRDAGGNPNDTPDPGDGKPISPAPAPSQTPDIDRQQSDGNVDIIVVVKHNSDGSFTGTSMACNKGGCDTLGTETFSDPDGDGVYAGDGGNSAPGKPPEGSYYGDFVDASSDVIFTAPDNSNSGSSSGSGGSSASVEHQPDPDSENDTFQGPPIDYVDWRFILYVILGLGNDDELTLYIFGVGEGTSSTTPTDDSYRRGGIIVSGHSRRDLFGPDPGDEPTVTLPANPVPSRPDVRSNNGGTGATDPAR